MKRLFIVRHAMPVVDSAVAPGDWPLTPQGRADAQALRDRLPDSAFRIASGERKAQETLWLAQRSPFEVDQRVNEVHRPVEPVDPGVRAVRRAWVSGRLDERHEGWETPTAAASRFEAALHSAPGGDVIVASHGMIITAWLVSVGWVSPGEAAAEFWQRLALPDIVTIDLGDARG